MNKRKKQYNDPWDRDFYETGAVRPPKERDGLVAVLLVAVILLGGLCSAMGIVNLRLLNRLAEGERTAETVHLLQEQQCANRSETTDPYGCDSIPLLGVDGQTVSEFDRRYYELPQGVLVTDVIQGSSADRAGIRTGDVIVSVAGRSASDWEQLADVLCALASGEAVQLECYRSQTREQFCVTVTISDEE